ncbi:Peptide deformylase [Chlamydiales bacterium STE3]|nr:Peptide deformylase [Chlamydiales bacterium STE3]
MILELAYYGESVLRKKAQPIEKINDEIRNLVSDMVETMHAKNGIGLAAPQVFYSLNLFIIQIPEQGPDDTTLPGTLRVFINPRIISVSENSCIYQEGCLSIPKLYENVERPIEVTVEAQGLDGEIFLEKFTGYSARAILHENDHINGVLFIDRIKGKKRQEIEPILRQIKKKYFLKK